MPEWKEDGAVTSVSGSSSTLSLSPCPVTNTTLPHAFSQNQNLILGSPVLPVWEFEICALNTISST